MNSMRMPFIENEDLLDRSFKRDAKGQAAVMGLPFLTKHADMLHWLLL